MYSTRICSEFCLLKYDLSTGKSDLEINGLGNEIGTNPLLYPLDLSMVLVPFTMEFGKKIQKVWERDITNFTYHVTSKLAILN